MCARVMTEELTHARFVADQIFVHPSCASNNGAFDLERFRLLVDRIKPLLGPRLEDRIHSGLEEFVCKSSSRYSRRFPRVKRCLDAVAAWLNYLDAFRSKDIEGEAIKHAIEYLLKDDRVTHLEDPVVLDAGLNKVDLDSLTEQNAMKNMNVWRFIKEKDYWLCQDQEQTTSTCEPRINSQVQKCAEENGNSDLDVEIGSNTKDLPVKVTQNRFCTKKTCRNQKIDDLKSEIEVQYDPQIVSCSKQNTLDPSKELLTTIESKALSCKRNLLKPSEKISFDSQITKLFQTRKNLQKSSTKVLCDAQITSCSKYNTQNLSEEISTVNNKPKHFPTRTNLPKQGAKIPYEPQITFCSKQDPLNSSEEALTIKNETKLLQTRRNLSKSIIKIPCGSNITSCSKQNILPKPCTKVSFNCIQNCDQNLCPKNPKLKVIIHKTINKNGTTLWNPPKVSSLSIPCKSSRLIVRLFEAEPSLSDSCLVLIRRKFEHDIRNACSCLNDIFHRLDGSTTKRLCLNCHIHPGRIDLILQRDDESSKTRLFLARVPICLNVHKRESSRGNGRSEECQGSNKNLDYKEEFQERRFAFYSQCSDHGSMEEKRSSKDVTGKGVNFVWSRRETKEVDFVLSSTFTKSKDNEDVEENSALCTKENYIEICDDAAVEKKDICENSSVMEDDNQRNWELGHICGSSSGSSKEERDSEQCFCHVLCANGSNKNSELENSVKEEERVSEPQNDVKEENSRLEIRKEAEESSTLQIQDFSKLERNIVTVKSSTLQVQKTLITTEENFEIKETYMDSISKNNSKMSCDSKCSRCGKDLSDEETENPKFSDSETCRTLNSISTRNMNLNEPTKISISSMKTTSRIFIMKNENLPIERPLNRSKNLINNNHVPEDTFTPEILESCKCPGNLNCESSIRTNTEAENFSEKNSNRRNGKFKSKLSKKQYHSSSSSKARCKGKEDTSFLLSRRKNSFWRGSIVPGSFCGSFPALDRIKYLIRKKLRRLLLEERDKGTGTSKTCLKNDRYLVSISSGKLNEERICSSVRCPFTTRNQIDTRSPQTTFTEGNFLKKDAFGDAIKGKRMIQDNEVLRKIRLAEISRCLCRKGGSKIDNHRINEQDQDHRNKRRRGRSSMESFDSTRVIFFEDVDKTKRRNRRTFSKRILKGDVVSPNFISRKNCRGRGDTWRDDKSMPFEKRPFKYCTIEDYDDDNDFMNLLSSYERRISDLDADFRLKLLQYVALCRSVKDLLMKRLPRPDDVYEGSSSSV